MSDQIPSYHYFVLYWHQANNHICQEHKHQANGVEIHAAEFVVESAQTADGEEEEDDEEAHDDEDEADAEVDVGAEERRHPVEGERRPHSHHHRSSTQHQYDDVEEAVESSETGRVVGGLKVVI